MVPYLALSCYPSRPFVLESFDLDSTYELEDIPMYELFDWMASMFSLGVSSLKCMDQSIDLTIFLVL